MLDIVTVSKRSRFDREHYCHQSHIKHRKEVLERRAGLQASRRIAKIQFETGLNRRQKREITQSASLVVKLVYQTESLLNSGFAFLLCFMLQKNDKVKIIIFTAPFMDSRVNSSAEKDC